jgi:hypothetical protein
MVQLQQLGLYNNGLTGPLPESWSSSMTHLVECVLYLAIKTGFLPCRGMALSLCCRDSFESSESLWQRYGLLRVEHS